ncbi:MAG: hypothetical protein J6U58_05555 [Bacteroidaceae bacterium]|nr:hypothetical protein [Bacteroidaceae bacterium]
MRMVLETTDVNSSLYLNISLGLMNTEDKEWLKANRSRWNWKLREFAGHSSWDTFLTVDFINEKL